MKNQNSAFMMFIFTLGCILTWTSWDIQNKLDKASGCTNLNIKRANKGVSVIGLTFIVSSICFYVCMSKCGNDSAGGKVYSMNFYVGISLLLGITLIVLGSMIIGGAKKSCKDAVKGNSANMILIIGVFMTAACIGYLFKQYGHKLKSAPASQFRF